MLLARLPAAQDFHFDIDTHLNKVIPSSPLWRLPKSISRWAGHRAATAGPDVGNILVATWALLGTFLGLLLVAATMKYSPWIGPLNPPVLIASLGAAAVLDFNTIYSPLAQPRNSIFGHTVAAFVGVCFAKLMFLDDATDATSWLLAPLACGAASAIMTLLNSVYPPGGATAVLAVADPMVRKLGWIFVLLVFIASLEMLVVACLVNNIQRRYPLWWWSPLETGSVYQRQRRPDVENLKSASLSSEADLKSQGSIRHEEDAAVVPSREEAIVIAADGMLSVPHGVQLDEHERIVLQGLLEKLQTSNYGRSVTEKSWTGDSEPS